MYITLFTDWFCRTNHCTQILYGLPKRKELRLWSWLFSFLGALTVTCTGLWNDTQTWIQGGHPPNFALTISIIPIKKKKDPVNLHLAPFKKERKGGSSKHVFTPSKCIWMQVFSASVLYSKSKTTDHIQQLELRPSRSNWNIYRQKTNFKGSRN